MAAIALRFAAGLFGIGLTTLLPFSAHAQERVALVIGNGKYLNATALPNPANDARAVATALRAIGFDVVEGIDLTRTAMEERVRAFLGKAGAAKVAFLFYAGHGLQVDGRNYLVPVDTKLESASDLNFGTVELDKILASLDDPARANIIILDACRDNPLARSFATRTRSAAVGTGLAAYTALGTGTLIAFSTAPGKVAADGQGANSPFTEALTRHLRTPGLEVRQMLTRVRNEVATATGEKQVPWDNSSLRGDVYLAGLPGGQVAAPASPAAPVAAADETTWSFVKDTKDPDQLRRFIEQFPASARRGEAAARLLALEQAKVAAVAPPVAPAAPPAAAPQPAVGVFPPPRAAKPLSPAEERALKPKDSFKECDACPEMVVVPAGSFMMGSPESEKDRSSEEGPQHRVTFARQFAVGKFSVTFDQFAAFVQETAHDAGSDCETYEGAKWEKRSGRSWRNPGFPQSGSHPAVCINWDDAKAYVAWLSKKTGKSYRLLSEAEREYVTRAGTTTPFWFGSSISTSQANYNGEHTYGDGSKGEFRQKTLPVNSFQPNRWGLYQVHGNVLERTEDCWNDSYRGAPTDGSAWTSGDCSHRLLRGGSWLFHPRDLRSANRERGHAVYRFSVRGFRVARTLTP